MTDSQFRAERLPAHFWEPSPELREVHDSWLRVTWRSGVAFAVAIGTMALGSWLTDNVNGWFIVLFVVAYVGAFVAWGVLFFVGGRLKWRETRMRRAERAAWKKAASEGGRA